MKSKAFHWILSALLLPVAGQAQIYYYTNGLDIFSYTNTASQITILQYLGSSNAVTVPDTIASTPVTVIGESSFANCLSPVSVTIPDGITSIRDDAFANCANLASITLPNSVTDIGNYTFYSCTALTNAPIGNHLISIGQWAFAYCNLPSVTIPDTVTLLGSYAFYGCGGLVSATIGNHVTTLGVNTFYGCGLKSVVIGNRVTSLGYGVFKSCYQLTGIYFQGNAPAVNSDTSVFNGAPTLSAAVYYYAGTKGWGATFDGLPTVRLGITGLGVQGGQFGFTFNGTNSQAIIVQACTNLASPNWQPLQTNTLSGPTFYFTDSNWTNYPQRFYRVGFPQ